MQMTVYSVKCVILVQKILIFLSKSITADLGKSRLSVLCKFTFKWFYFMRLTAYKRVFQNRRKGQNVLYANAQSLPVLQACILHGKCGKMKCILHVQDDYNHPFEH